MLKLNMLIAGGGSGLTVRSDPDPTFEKNPDILPKHHDTTLVNTCFFSFCQISNIIRKKILQTTLLSKKFIRKHFECLLINIYLLMKTTGQELRVSA